jgi:DNA-binding NtrC family response regulator
MKGTESIHSDVRVIAASNKDLAEMMAQGSFRRDLYERLCVIHLAMPPLRERKEDIARLAYHFVRKYGLKEERNIVGFTPAALQCLQNYSWPHNVRELENRIWRAVLDARGDRIDVTDLPRELTGFAPLTGQEPTLDEIVRNAKRTAVLNVVRKNRKIKDAAAILGIEPNSLSRLVTELGLRDKVDIVR